MLNGVKTRPGTFRKAQPTPNADTPSLISTLENGHPEKFRKRKKGVNCEDWQPVHSADPDVCDTCVRSIAGASLY
jgi:hypothetical protein